MVKVGKQRRTRNERADSNAQIARNLAAPGPERVLFIGTQFSNLDTAVDTPASDRVIQARVGAVRVGAVRCGAGRGEAERSGAPARPKGFVEQPELEVLSPLMEFEKAPTCNPLHSWPFTTECT